MDLGIHYANFSHPEWQTRLADRLTATAQAADEGGVALFTVMDHYFQMEMLGGPPEPMLEGYTTLGYLAGITERVDLGLLVTGVTYRHPGLLAKIVTTLDVLSGGRAWLNLGAAWYDREHEGLGVPFPPTAERFERLEETLQIVRQMWSDDDGPYEGAHYRLAETVNVPAPTRDRVPVLVGGTGERKTLRLVAQYADACNLFAEGTEVMKHKLSVLREHCDRLGTDYDAIRTTILVMTDPLADRDGFLREMEEYAALGVSLVTMMPPSDDPEAWVTTVAEEIVPRLSEL
ncbi:LLM class F420-dependent oxidoreductase [Nocardioides sp. GY 10113]|uniref:LLM class F420-dependent oxidoreductase n=1 Tax=Nocardioides sp. GY 10113 TaxID=2569761 RepID=UPI0010A86EE8|nr:LLM class F420-dependent oxidoreductase [Nocardioides sp. GY 10113]TIC87639.1 LLM class F420-dependent oxidoreductase [Nocardioides sp. GY 10113]